MTLRRAMPEMRCDRLSHTTSIIPLLFAYWRRWHCSQPLTSFRRAICSPQPVRLSLWIISYLQGQQRAHCFTLQQTPLPMHCQLFRAVIPSNIGSTAGFSYKCLPCLNWSSWPPWDGVILTWADHFPSPLQQRSLYGMWSPPCCLWLWDNVIFVGFTDQSGFYYRF